MPETAGGRALLADPHDPSSVADAILKACGPEGDRLRAGGPERAAEFTWAATAEKTLAVYREVHARRGKQGGRS
jgi:glycosyltransferase involved in cell wall biosynthesis